MMKRKIQRERVLDYMRENGTITTMEAFAELNITRLAEAIRQLRELGYVIDSEPVRKVRADGSIVNYEKFYIAKEPA